MKLIKQLNTAAQTSTTISEDAAGGASGAGAVAGMSMPLFSTLVRRSTAATAPVAKSPLQGLVKKDEKKSKKKGMGLAEAYRALSEDEATAAPDMMGAKTNQRNFDSTEVIAKLKGLEAKNQVDKRDTVSFGLEDDDGGVVRVAVKSEQAEEFEKALQTMMVDRDDDEGEIPEIAEVLFRLKDHFDIIDVVWPDVVEDEEEPMELDAADPNAEEMPMDDMGDVPPEGADTGQVQDLLTQVIDMMKADAEARKAEALAREAEAKTKQADAIVAQTMARVKQEEQYLDMESHQKAEKEQSREAKRLAQLAKWKHSMSQGGSSSDSDDGFSDDTPIQPRREGAPEEEEATYRKPAMTRAQPQSKPNTVRGRVAPHDIAQFIIGRVK